MDFAGRNVDALPPEPRDGQVAVVGVVVEDLEGEQMRHNQHVLLGVFGENFIPEALDNRSRLHQTLPVFELFVESVATEHNLNRPGDCRPVVETGFELAQPVVNDHLARFSLE